MISGYSCVFLTKGTTEHPNAVSTKCSHHCYYLMISGEFSTIISNGPLTSPMLRLSEVDSYLTLSLHRGGDNRSLQDECWQGGETLISMNLFLFFFFFSHRCIFLPYAATSQAMIIAIIMKKQLPDPFYNVRVVNYLLGTKLFGTQQREQTE